MIFGKWVHNICLRYHFIDKSFIHHILTNEPSQSAIKYSKLTTETLEQAVKYVQS